MIHPRVTPHFLAALGPLAAADFPVVPGSADLLTPGKVKAYWLAHLHPQRPPLENEIRSGKHDIAARLVALNHNIAASMRRGDPARADAEEHKLTRLRERVARAAGFHVSALKPRR